MDRLHVVLAPQLNQTRMLAMWGPNEVLRAVLGSPHQVHRLAAPLLLEGLSLWYHRPLSVVLSVGEADASSALIQSLPGGLRIGDSTLCYQVDVVGAGRRPGQVIPGLGDFRALRRLCQEGSSWR